MGGPPQSTALLAMSMAGGSKRRSGSKSECHSNEETTCRPLESTQQQLGSPTPFFSAMPASPGLQGNCASLPHDHNTASSLAAASTTASFAPSNIGSQPSTTPKQMAHARRGILSSILSRAKGEAKDAGSKPHGQALQKP